MTNTFASISQNEYGIIKSNDRNFSALLTYDLSSCVALAISSPDKSKHALMHIALTSSKESIESVIRQFPSGSSFSLISANDRKLCKENSNNIYRLLLSHAISPKLTVLEVGVDTVAITKAGALITNITHCDRATAYKKARDDGNTDFNCAPSVSIRVFSGPANIGTMREPQNYQMTKSIANSNLWSRDIALYSRYIDGNHCLTAQHLDTKSEEYILGLRAEGFLTNEEISPRLTHNFLDGTFGDPNRPDSNLAIYNMKLNFELFADSIDYVIRGMDGGMIPTPPQQRARRSDNDDMQPDEIHYAPRNLENLKRETVDLNREYEGPEMDPQQGVSFLDKIRSLQLETGRNVSYNPTP